MFLKALILNNYMSYKEERIDFPPEQEITTIVGANCSGKTVIQRALKMVLFSESWPESYLRDGQIRGEVTLELYSGWIIKRIRTKSEQFLQITSPSGEVETRKGFRGTEELVAKVTGVRKLEIDRDGKEHNLNVISVDDESQILRLNPVALHRRVGAMIGGQNSQATLDTLLRSRKTLGDHVLNVERRLESLPTEATILNSLNELNQFRTEFQEKLKNRDEISDLLNKLEEIEKEFAHLELKTQEGVKQSQDFTEILDKLSPILRRIEEIQNSLRQLEDYERELGLLESRYEQAKATLLEDEKELEELRAKIKDLFPQEICVTCGRPKE